MRICCWIAAALFTLFAFLQLNDLEQYGTDVWFGWVYAYGLVALVSMYSARAPLPRWVYGAGAALAVVGAAVRSTSIEWDSAILYNESNPAGNETGGLLLVAVWMIALTVWAARGSNETPAHD